MNAFVTAFENRIALAVSKNSAESNIKMLQDLRDTCNNTALVALFEASAIDPSRFMRAMYASKKTMRFAAIATDLTVKKFDENTYAIFRTAINCARHNVAMTKYDAECSISKDLKVAADKTHIVFQRNAINDAQTIAAQHQTSLDALRTLNIISDKNDARNAYNVHLTDLALAIAAKLNIDTTSASDDEAEADTDERVNVDAE